MIGARKQKCHRDIRKFDLVTARNLDHHGGWFDGRGRTGTTFSVKSVTAEGEPYTLPPVSLTRGARHLAFLPGGRSLVVLRGEIQHKNLWVIDRQTGTEHELTDLPPDFEINDFDISPDGHEVVLERVQDRSDIVMVDLSRP
jgi:dipeptidyl aminopeptidase/acylaminoacyl peptidase